MKIIMLLTLLLNVSPLAAANDNEHLKLIVGDLDWMNVKDLDQKDVRRQSASPVADLGLKKLIIARSRCTGFLINEDTLMTNEHCVPKSSRARGLLASFRYETGLAGENKQSIECSEYIGSNKGLDYALVRCTGKPGLRFGHVTLSREDVLHNEEIYVVHQNCDFNKVPRCAWIKKLSPGIAQDYTGAEIAHTADTLGGSSGAPVFHAETHEVVGLHRAGQVIDNGKNNRNYAVKMRLIIDDIEKRFPRVHLP